MPDSIQEAIIKKIATVLTTVAPVQRDMANGPDLAIVPTIVIQEGDSIVELGESIYPSIRRRMKLNAVAILKQTESADLRSDAERLNAMMADMEICVATNRTWDGLAIQTDPPNYAERIVDDETPHLARALEFDVVFQHIRTNPYSQG